MPAILVRLTAEQAEVIRRAAKRAGMSQQSYCLRLLTGAMATDAEELLREVHAAVCGNGRAPPERGPRPTALAEAASALRTLGMKPQEADAKVRAAAKAIGEGATTEQIVVAATQAGAAVNGV